MSLLQDMHWNKTIKIRSTNKKNHTHLLAIFSQENIILLVNKLKNY